MGNFEIADDGIPGLTLALRLRLKGHAVALVPSNVRAALPHEFTLPAPYRDLMLKTGGPLEDVAELVPAEPLEFRVGDARIRMPQVGVQSHAIASALGAHAGEQWADYMRAAAEIWGALRSGNYHSQQSLRRFARAHLRDGRLRQLLAEYTSARGVDFATVGDAAAVLPYLDQTFGRWTLNGGLEVLEAELRTRCAALGVTETPSSGELISVDTYWATSFTAPKRSWSIGNAPAVSSVSMGLPWIGMAAEFIADHIGRATAPKLNA